MCGPRVSHYVIIRDEHPKGASRITNPKNKKTKQNDAVKDDVAVAIAVC
jgi:hypothetical protein